MSELDQALTDMLRGGMPLCAQFGMEALSGGPNEVVLRMAWSADRCTAAGVLHGGALMALADSAGATLAFLNLPEGAQGTTTIESKTNFLGAVTEGTVLATSTPVHVGGRTIVVQTDVTDDSGGLVARTTQTQMVLE